MTTHTHAERSTCGDVQHHAFAACDGELTPAELATVEAHVAHCGVCLERLTADATFRCVVRRAATLQVAPASLRERIALLLHQHATENASA